MIGEEWQFWVIGGQLQPGGPACWQVGDWDQRRMISVTFNFENDAEDEDLAIEYLRRHYDNLGTDVCAIEVSKDGKLVSVSSDPGDDETPCPHFPPLRDLQLDRVDTVLRSELCELDRLGPNVDLVSYQNRKSVFKYYFHSQFLEKRWDEMNLWMRLSAHPNIVPFDRVVVEEMDGSQDHIVGFITLHIAGGTLDAIKENPGDDRIFKLKWLLQLMNLVDDLYYKYGIQHQDIAPRNLLVDEATDKIMLFDFNVSARIGAPAGENEITYFEYRDDIKGVIFTLYEIITRDDHFRSVPHRDQDSSSVLNMTVENWVKHPDVRLDEPVAAYRAELDAWVLRRKERGSLEIFTDASDYFDWPELSEPTRKRSYANNGADSDLEPETYPIWAISRRNAKDESLEVIEWRRPAQKTIKEGMWVYADGRVVNAANQALESS